MVNLMRYLAKVLALVCLWGVVTAQERLPEMTPMRILDLGIYWDQNDKEVVAFSAAIMNTGRGRLEIYSEKKLSVEGTEEKSNAYQVIYDERGRVSRRVLIGEFVFHPEHDHWHVENAAEYAFYFAPSGDNGTSGNFGTQTPIAVEKVSFCMRDSGKNHRGIRDRRRYRRCSGNTQGISAGYYDFYNYQIGGQNFDADLFEIGRIYYLVNRVNPRGNFIETDGSNNMTWTSFRIRRSGGQRTLEEIAHAPCTRTRGGCGENADNDNIDRGN